MKRKVFKNLENNYIYVVADINLGSGAVVYIFKENKGKYDTMHMITNFDLDEFNDKNKYINIGLLYGEIDSLNHDFDIVSKKIKEFDDYALNDYPIFNKEKEKEEEIPEYKEFNIFLKNKPDENGIVDVSYNNYRYEWKNLLDILDKKLQKDGNNIPLIISSKDLNSENVDKYIIGQAIYFDTKKYIIRVRIKNNKENERIIKMISNKNNRSRVSWFLQGNLKSSEDTIFDFIIDDIIGVILDINPIPSKPINIDTTRDNINNTFRDISNNFKNNLNDIINDNRISEIGKATKEFCDSIDKKIESIFK